MALGRQIGRLQAIGKSRGGWNTKLPMVAADARTAVTVSRSPGRVHDAPEGRALLRRGVGGNRPMHFLMDRAYVVDETRQLSLYLGFIPGVPPLKTRVEPREFISFISFALIADELRLC